MSVDGCYSEKNRKEFSAYKICVDVARFTYEYVKYIIANFKGDGEKSYPLFYKTVSEEKVFKYISKRSSILLGFEGANLVLSYLTGLAIKESRYFVYRKGIEHHK